MQFVDKKEDLSLSNKKYVNDFEHKLHKVFTQKAPVSFNFKQDKHWSLLEELILMDWTISKKDFTTENIAKRVSKTIIAVYTKRNRLLDPRIEFFRELLVDDTTSKLYCQKAKKFFEMNGYTVIYDDIDITDVKKLISIKGKSKTVYITIRYND